MNNPKAIRERLVATMAVIGYLGAFGFYSSSAAVHDYLHILCPACVQFIGPEKISLITYLGVSGSLNALLFFLLGWGGFEFFRVLRRLGSLHGDKPRGR